MNQNNSNHFNRYIQQGYFNGFFEESKKRVRKLKKPEDFLGFAKPKISGGEKHIGHSRFVLNYLQFCIQIEMNLAQPVFDSLKFSQRFPIYFWIEVILLLFSKYILINSQEMFSIYRPKGRKGIYCCFVRGRGLFDPLPCTPG